jgi:DNA adenine methylase
MKIVNNEPKIKTRPLLKWPGGKRGILNSLLPLVPTSFHTYYEPFVGGGALFFAIEPSSAFLSDSNPELINCYIQVRDHADEVTEHLIMLRNTEEDYYKVRDNVPTNPAAKAARLIYLVTLSFNGIHRLNLRGQFNVPYGHKTYLEPCDPGRIQAVSAALARAEIMCADFESVAAFAGKGDLIYLDPPYTVAHGNNGFLKYNARIFSWGDQVRLSKLAESLASRGCQVIVSNANHPSIAALYPGFRVRVVERVSRIAASSDFRRKITECIFYNEV